MVTPVRFSLVLLCSALSAHAAVPIKIASFSTILTELAQKIGGDRAEVAGLVKPGDDPHSYNPTPADLKRVSAADLVLLSAKHLEDYLARIKEVAGGNGSVIEVGDQFPSLRMNEGSRGLIEDPHWWHSIDNVKRAVRVVRDALIQLSPGDEELFNANAAAYSKQLDELQKWARAEMAKLPRDRRKLVTSHDAFGYFARDFGFTVYPVEGISPDDEPASRRVADLIAAIKAQDVKAVFLENTQNPKVVQEIVRESGAKVGGTLYADGLGEGEAGTFEGMYRHNVSTIVNALR